MIPPHQARNDQTPIKGTTQYTQNTSHGSHGFDFLTPVSFMTGIKNLNTPAAKVRFLL